MRGTRSGTLHLIAHAALLSGGCVPEDPAGAAPFVPRALYAFESCDEVLEYVRENADQRIDEYGNLWGHGYDGGFGETGAGGESAGDGGDPGDGGGGEEGEDYSGTNVQELGVDEPDLVKTDGERILALAQGRLHFVDTSGASPLLRGSLELGASDHDAEMFLHEDRAVVLLRGYGYGGCDGVACPPEGVPLPAPVDANYYGPLLRLVEVDLRDPDRLRIAGTLYIAGDLVSARMVEGVARMIVRSAPQGLVFRDPYEFVDWAAYEQEVAADGYSDALWQKYFDLALAQAKLHNKSVIAASTLDNWLPRYVHEDLSGDAPNYSQGFLVDCHDVMHAGANVGLSTLSVLTVDLDADLALAGGVAIFSEGEVVYASKDSLYVTHSPWQPQLELEQGRTPDASGGFTTYVHEFDIRDRRRAVYLASGEVRGRVRSQWSLSEWQGDLRLATTDRQGWDTASSENFVSVLRRRGAELAQIGQVGGLGLGEEIQGVRFIGDVGYVVTFRQTDPLYTLDLSDPAAPKAVGELKIPGFSAYLHPVGEGLLLGVGRDGTPDGQLLGLQLSLFDVADIDAPVRLHQLTVGSDWGWSEALFDHRAFLWWPKTRLAMLPVEWSEYDDAQGWYTSHMSAFGFTVDAAAGISPLGAVEHPTPMVDPDDCWEGCAVSAYLRRSLVIGDLVYTLSDQGLKASRLADLADVHWIEL